MKEKNKENLLCEVVWEKMELAEGKINFTKQIIKNKARA